MEDVEVMLANDDTEVTLEGFGVAEAKELKQLLTRFLREYGKKPQELSDEDWLRQRFLEELPDMSEDEASALSSETLASVQEYDRNLSSLMAARAQGSTAEEWFAEKSREAAVGISAIQFGIRMEGLGDTIDQANAQLYRTVMTQSGEISRQINLDGFLAEQMHVNSFNAAAKLSGSPFRAEVCVPEAGQTYGKNSFDVVIRGKNGRIVHQYQFKYGADAQSTIQLIKHGNYNNQTLVVPPEQVDAVQAAFPGKTVVAQIGGTDKVPVVSKPLSKADVKSMQEEIQQTGTVPEQDWNLYDNRMLGKYVAGKAAFAGIMGAAMGAGFHMAAKIAADEPIEVEEVVTDALRTGADSGIKAAAAGALKVASERGIIRVIAPGTPMSTFVDIVCVSIEDIKILGRVASGELTMGEALDEMCCTAVAMYYSLGFGAAGMAIGAVALGWIPIVGPIVGGVVGGVIGYAAGSKFGEGIYKAAKNAAQTAIKTAKKMVQSAKNAAGKVFRGLGRMVGLSY